MEVLLSTSDGIIMFLKSDGTPIPGQMLQVYVVQMLAA
jgi:hypothetical protein